MTQKNSASVRKLIPSIPNFGTLVFGILIGIFASCLTLFMFATADITLKIPALPLAKAKTNTVAVVAQKAEPAPQEPRFDFYTELTKNEAAEPTAKESKGLNSKPKTINGYILQAGLYRKAADADALRAKLTLNGYTAKIETVKQRNGETWQRVTLGSFKTEQAAKALQQQLRSIDIDSNLITKYTE